MSKETKTFCLTPEGSFSDSGHGAFKFDCGEKPTWLIYRIFHMMYPSHYAALRQPDFQVQEDGDLAIGFITRLFYIGNGWLNRGDDDEAGGYLSVGDWSNQDPTGDPVKDIYTIDLAQGWNPQYPTAVAYNLNYGFDFILAESVDNYGIKMRIYTGDLDDKQYGYVNENTLDRNELYNIGTWQRAIDLGDDRVDPYFILDATVEDGLILWDEIYQCISRLKWVRKTINSHKNARSIRSDYCDEDSSQQAAYEARWDNVTDYVDSYEDNRRYSRGFFQKHGSNSFYNVNMLQSIFDAYEPLVEDAHYFRTYMSEPYNNFCSDVDVYQYLVVTDKEYFSYFDVGIGAGALWHTSGDYYEMNIDHDVSVNDLVSYPGDDVIAEIEHEHFVCVDLTNHPAVIHINEDQKELVIDECYACNSIQIDIDNYLNNFRELYQESFIPYGLPGGPQLYKDMGLLSDDSMRQVIVNFNRFNPEHQEVLPDYVDRDIRVDALRNFNFPNGDTVMHLDTIESVIVLSDTEYTTDSFDYQSDVKIYVRPMEPKYYYYAQDRLGMDYRIGSAESIITHNGRSDTSYKVKLKNITTYDCSIESAVNFGTIKISSVYKDSGEDLDVSFTAVTPADQTKLTPIDTIVTFDLQDTSVGEHISTYYIVFTHGLILSLIHI